MHLHPVGAALEGDHLVVSAQVQASGAARNTGDPETPASRTDRERNHVRTELQADVKAIGSRAGDPEPAADPRARNSCLHVLHGSTHGKPGDRCHSVRSGNRIVGRCRDSHAHTLLVRESLLSKIENIDGEAKCALVLGRPHDGERVPLAHDSRGVMQSDLMVAWAIASDGGRVPPQHVATTALRDDCLAHADGARAHRKQQEDSLLP